MFLETQLSTVCLRLNINKLPQGTYVYDVLMSVATEAQLWHTLWRVPRTTQSKKISTIIVPINIPRIYWYVAILHLDKMGVKLNIQNNIKMRDKRVEAKLMTIGRKYHQKMWNQPITQKKYDYSQETDTNTNTDSKRSNSTKHYCAKLKQT